MSEFKKTDIVKVVRKAIGDDVIGMQINEDHIQDSCSESKVQLYGSTLRDVTIWHVDTDQIEDKRPLMCEIKYYIAVYKHKLLHEEEFIVEVISYKRSSNGRTGILYQGTRNVHL